MRTMSTVDTPAKEAGAVANPSANATAEASAKLVP